MATSAPNKCNLLLYYKDKRVSEDTWSDQTEISLSKQAADRANDTICGFFRVTEKWDRQLFKSAFSSDFDFNQFNFVRIDSPHLVYGIELSGDRTVIFSHKPEVLEALDRGAHKVHVSVKSVFGNNDYDLALDDLRGERRLDQAIVALYNSESFSKHTQYSTNLRIGRLLEFI